MLLLVTKVIFTDVILVKSKGEIAKTTAWQPKNQNVVICCDNDQQTVRILHPFEDVKNLETVWNFSRVAVTQVPVI